MKFLSRICTVAVLFMMTSALLTAQNVSTIEYSPGYVPPGTHMPDRDRGVEIIPSSESMQKTTAPITIPEGITSPVIDGTLSPGEWSDAVEINPWAVTTAGNKAWFKIDACQLSIAAILKTPSGFASRNATMLNIWFDLDRRSS